jgi:outer membrane biosynthesis protein TonB
LRFDIESTGDPAEVALPAGRPRTTLDLAVAKLHTALQQRSGYVVVTAETGERAEALFTAVEPRLRTFRTVRVSGSDLDPEAIVRALWHEGEPPFPARLAMRTLIDEARAAAQPIVVAITDADTADPARLERVRLTLEGAPDASEIIHIALLGGPALIELLRRPDTRAVAMRIGATVQVPSVTTDIATAMRTPVERRRGGMLAIVAVAAIAVGGIWLAWRSNPPPASPVTTAKPAPPPPTGAPPVAAPLEAPPPPHEPAQVEASPVPAPSAPPMAAPVPAPSNEQAPAIVSVSPTPAATASAAPAVVGALQVGAFVRSASADALRSRLAPRFPGVVVSPATRDGTTYYRVRIAGFANGEARDAAARALRASGYTPVRVRD